MFLHVPGYASAGQPDAEHPTQGRLPTRKLVWTPPALLLDILSSLRSRANGASPAMGPEPVATVGDGDLPGYTAVRTVSRTTSRCGFSGLTTRGFGACTVMLGSVAPPEGVCAIAAPLRPHNNAIDRI